MKREILFRGKNLYKDEWVYGVPVKTNSLSGVSLITELYHVDGAEYNAIECDIIPETVGQFTGLTDKNGTKIFEGDHFGNKNFPVYFDEGLFLIGGIPLKGYFNGEYMTQLSIIKGNIHDNPTT